MAKRRQDPQRLKGEGSGGHACEHPREIRGQLLGLPRRELRGRRTGLSVIGIRYDRAITHGPHIGGPRHTHVWVRGKATALEGEAKRPQQGMHGGANRGDDGGCLYLFARLETHPQRRDFLNFGVEADLDPAPA
jgi:hypothetical protein